MLFCKTFAFYILFDSLGSKYTWGLADKSYLIDKCVTCFVPIVDIILDKSRLDVKSVMIILLIKLRFSN